MAATRSGGKRVLESTNIDAVAKYIAKNKPSNIIVMSGAGVSTSAGIPDFRSPGTGLYENLRKFELPYPEAIFDINYLHHHPEPFYALAKELYPGLFLPTLTHYFIRLLAEKNMLIRNFSQNIDTLENIAGIPNNLIVEAHGSFNSAHCIGRIFDDISFSSSSGSESDSDSINDSEIESHSSDLNNEVPDGSLIEPEPIESASFTESEIGDEVPTIDGKIEKSDQIVPRPENIVACGKEFSKEWVKGQILEDKVPICDKCGGLVKPDIVFFGEDLPSRFYDLSHKDFKKCDLLIIIGTSLKVHPFAGLIDLVKADVPRFLINREKVGEMKDSYGRSGFDFSGKLTRYRRDALYLGDCDEGCFLLAKLLGLDGELLKLYHSHTKELEIKFSINSSEKRDWKQINKSILKNIDKDVAMAFKHIHEEQERLLKEEELIIEELDKLEI